MSRKGVPNRNGKAAGWLASSGYRYKHDSQHPNANSSGKIAEHIFIASKALGKPLPEDAVVHHFNEIKSDNKNSNLVICVNNAYHGLLHARQRVMNAGADPNTESFCIKCRKVGPFSDFNRHPETWNGVGKLCRNCDHQRQAAHRRKNGIPERQCRPYKKLTTQQRIAIQSDSRSQRKIAQEFGVDKATVGRIKSRGIAQDGD